MKSGRGGFGQGVGGYSSKSIVSQLCPPSVEFSRPPQRIFKRRYGSKIFLSAVIFLPLRQIQTIKKTTINLPRKIPHQTPLSLKSLPIQPLPQSALHQPLQIRHPLQLLNKINPQPAKISPKFRLRNNLSPKNLARSP